MKSALYEGVLRHRRALPRAHEFSYPLFMAYLDLSELDEVFEGRWLWSAKRPAPVRFRREDHLGDPKVPLDESVRALVAQRTGRRPEGPIRLLTHLAYWGWCFNPISLYYCWDEEDRRVESVVAEVSNTPWGERHCYVLGELGEPGRLARFSTRKALHVSPFMPMEQDYDWKLRAPGPRLSVHIATTEGAAKPFDATLALTRREITGVSLASALARWPFMTLTVQGGIHWQAFKLWRKGVPVHDHPAKREAAA